MKPLQGTLNSSQDGQKMSRAEKHLLCGLTAIASQACCVATLKFRMCTALVTFWKCLYLELLLPVPIFLFFSEGSFQIFMFLENLDKKRFSKVSQIWCFCNLVFSLFLLCSFLCFFVLQMRGFFVSCHLVCVLPAARRQGLQFNSHLVSANFKPANPVGGHQPLPSSASFKGITAHFLPSFGKNRRLFSFEL